MKEEEEWDYGIRQSQEGLKKVDFSTYYIKLDEEE